MPIKASTARQIETLIADLGSERADVREAAVARLILAGARAVDRLLLMLDSGVPERARVAALRALEAIADPRAFDRVLDAIDTPDVAVAAAAASAARPLLRGPRGATAIDRLARAAMDTVRHEGVRIAAVRVLRDLDPATIAPLLDALRSDPSAAIQAAAALQAAVDPGAVIAHAVEGDLPDDPADLAEALTRARDTISLPLLLRLIEQVREREPAEPPGTRAVWTRLRGRAHVLLADRGSRVGLYDLRESIEAAGPPLPVDFLAALSTAGDASCLESIAAAYARTPSSGSREDSQDGWWRDHLADAFRTIVRREGLTKRHALIRKIEKRWGAALKPLSP